VWAAVRNASIVREHNITCLPVVTDRWGVLRVEQRGPTAEDSLALIATELPNLPAIRIVPGKASTKWEEE
jgi:hypothetical protein